MPNCFAIFYQFLLLGCYSFGGPVAHIGTFHYVFVKQRGWLSEKQFADLLALCQILPGPASSQLGYAIGLHKGRLPGAVSAWLGFTLPSAVIMLAAAYATIHSYNKALPFLFDGLKLAAAVIVTKAVISMQQQFCKNLITRCLALLGFILALSIPNSIVQLLVIATGACIGYYWLIPESSNHTPGTAINISKRLSYVALLLFALTLLCLPLINSLWPHTTMLIWQKLAYAGTMVFGGGHVVLPLLQTAFVPSQLNIDAFLAGYGAAQAVPGPLFSFAAYLAAVTANHAILWWVAGLLGLVAIFLPPLLLLTGVLPYWQRWQHYPRIQAITLGINAAVVGLLLSAWFNPIVLGLIKAPVNLLAAAIILLLSCIRKVPILLIISLCILAAYLISKLSI